MKKNKLIGIIIAAVVACGILAIIISNIVSGYIPSNPDNAIGNTPGNLMNDGLMCESDGTIYFANPYDANRLYSMSTECEDIKKLCDDSVSSLNTYGKYLYYTKKDTASDSQAVIFRSELFGLVRCGLDGRNRTTLVSGYCNDAALCGNELIYNANQNSLSVTNKIRTNGKGEATICKNNIDNASVVDGRIIYSHNGNNHCIYSMDIENGNISLYYECNSTKAMIYNNSLYYIDLDNNYALVRVDLGTNTKTILSGEHVVNYNIYDSFVYYQTEGDNRSDATHNFKKMDINGENVSLILPDADVSSISCTSKYTFFTVFGKNDLYRIENGNAGGKIFTFRISVEK